MGTEAISMRGEAVAVAVGVGNGVGGVVGEFAAPRMVRAPRR